MARHRCYALGCRRWRNAISAVPSLPAVLEMSFLTKASCNTCASGGHNPAGGEWEGVAGTVTAKLGKRLEERAAKTDAAILAESQKRAEHLSEQIMCVDNNNYPLLLP